MDSWPLCPFLGTLNIRGLTAYQIYTKSLEDIYSATTQDFEGATVLIVLDQVLQVSRALITAQALAGAKPDKV